MELYCGIDLHSTNSYVVVLVGRILGLTVLLETGDVGRFAGPGNFASYCRCVDAKRTSNGKCKPGGNRKCGMLISPGRLSRRHTSRCATTIAPSGSTSARRPRRAGR